MRRLFCFAASGGAGSSGADDRQHRERDPAGHEAAALKLSVVDAEVVQASTGSELRLEPIRPLPIRVSAGFSGFLNFGVRLPPALDEAGSGANRPATLRGLKIIVHWRNLLAQQKTCAARRPFPAQHKGEW